jgi:hypothetical protein
VKTADGTLVVEVSEPDSEVTVDGEKVTVTWAGGKGRAEVKVKPGEHTVLVTKDGFTMEGGRTVTVKEGEREVFKAALKPNDGAKKGDDKPKPVPQDTPPVKPVDAPEKRAGEPKPQGERSQNRPVELVPTGRNRLAELIGGNWAIEGDELVARAKAGMHRATFGSPDWTDYTLEFDAQTEKREVPVNRESGKTKTTAKTFQVRFRVKSDNEYYTCNIAAFNGDYIDLISQQLKRKVLHGGKYFVEAYNWHTYKVRVNGDRLELFIDNESIRAASDGQYRKGRVALVAQSGRTARFRNIRVTAPDGRVLWNGLPDLGKPEDRKPAVPDDKLAEDPPDDGKPLVAEEFKPLFNGKDLTGWINPYPKTNWVVINGELRSSGEYGFLRSARSDYKDFHLKAELLVNRGGRGGFQFRHRVVDEVIYCYEVPIDGRSIDRYRTGSVLRLGPPNVRAVHNQTEELTEPDTPGLPHYICCDSLEHE